MADPTNTAILEELSRIRRAFERLSPEPEGARDFSQSDAFVWDPSKHSGIPVARINRLPLSLLVGIDRSRDLLLENTRQFAQGLPANNALLWGARGTGKSSLVKAVHGDICDSYPATKLIEIHREDIGTLPRLMALVRGRSERFIVFCDDLSFSRSDTTYKSLKAVLEGGIEGRPANVVFYATSNRRHLMPRDMMENERSTAINPAEVVDENVSLSDRFGLWLGFHNCSQEEYLAMVDRYVEHFGLMSGSGLALSAIHKEALEWATTRGARSGRVAWQFIIHFAGKSGAELGL